MSKITSITAPSALLAALALVSVPAVAQERERYHGRQNPSGQESSGQSRERAQPRSEAPRARAEAQRPQAGAAPGVETRQQAPRAQAPAAPQQRAQPQQVQPQAQRQAAQPRVDNRANTNRAYGSRQNDNVRGETGRAVPQGRAYAPHYETHNAPHYAPRAYAPRGYGYYGSHTYYRPYVYRPHFSIGFGIYAGYPVPYTYSYAYPIAVYGYRAPRERVIVAPGSPYYGGIALEISPYDADVFVDGQYAGRVEDFDGTTQPLTLTAGMHELEVQAQGYEPLRVNVEIQPGQVIPYRGDLRAY